MKTTLLITLLCFTSFLCTAREVTLTINTNPDRGPIITEEEMHVLTNEVAEITTVFGGGAWTIEVIKSGLTNRITGLLTYFPIRIVGPGTFRLVAGQGINNPTFATIQATPESFPPDKTIILPEGTVGTIYVESSTNLVTWQDEWSQTFSNTNDNRFFRLRAERSLP